jgi:simple sugar transport system permease protein
MTQAAMETAQTAEQPPRRRAVLGSLRDLTLLPAILVLVVVGILWSNSAFFTKANLSNTAAGQAPLAVLVVAETIVLLTGYLDLSLQSIFGFAPGLGAWLIVDKAGHGLGTQWSPAVGILIVLAIGFLIGLVNGVMIVKLEFGAFIFTLAMLIMLAGLLEGMASDQSLYDMPSSFAWLGSAYWLGFPVDGWVAIAIFVVVGLFLRYHRTGRAVYAIGGNLGAARAAGIRVDRVRIGVFCVAGMLAAVAGLMLAGSTATITANQGNNYIFQVFAAAVIGGIALEGGRGTILGAFTGVVLLALVNNILILRQTNVYWQDFAYGAIIVLALVLQRLIGLIDGGTLSRITRIRG